jgi:hypothetical protein
VRVRGCCKLRGASVLFVGVDLATNDADKSVIVPHPQRSNAGLEHS